MTRTESAAVEASDSGAALQGAELDILIRDLGASFELTYFFENDEDEAIEALFTFPMPSGAAFVSLEAEIAGEVIAARVLTKRDATAKYDDAVAEGHSALLLEQVEPGLLHASLGNLGPGERARVTLRYVLELTATDGRARFRLPCAIRPRYGHWNLDDIHLPFVDPAVAYTLAANIRIEGLLADASVACPTHPARFVREGGATRIELLEAWLDGDLVLDFELGDQPIARAEAFPDGDAVGALAHVVIPDFDPPPAGRLDVVMVLDGSGSMTGDAVRGSRTALLDLLGHLDEGDRIQVLRFGSEVRPMLRRPLKATAQVRRALVDAADVIDADLGGTEIGKALERAMAELGKLADADRQRAIVLVTDGAVQPSEIDAVAGKAAAAGVRVFVVAVGSSAAVEVLQPLADRTEGQLEAVVPGESIRAAVLRQLRRMRHATPIQIRCAFDSETVDLVAPEIVYGGDAVRVAARLDGMPRTFRVFGPWVAPITVNVTAVDAEPSRQALLGHALYQSAEGAEDLERVAVHYGLLTPYTSAVVVKERIEGERFNALPATRVQPQMLPRGVADSVQYCAMPAFFRRADDSDYLNLHVSCRLDTTTPEVSPLAEEAATKVLVAVREAVIREAVLPTSATPSPAGVQSLLPREYATVLQDLFEHLGLDVASLADWAVFIDAVFCVRPIDDRDPQVEEAVQAWMVRFAGCLVDEARAADAATSLSRMGCAQACSRGEC